MSRRTRYSREVRERAVRMVIDHGGEYESRWEAIRSIAEKIGCSPESLRKGILRAEVDSGQRAGVTSEEQARMKALERENRELRRANEILRKARRILPRRSSTADRNDGVLYRRSPRGVRRSSGCGRRTSGSTEPARSGDNYCTMSDRKSPPWGRDSTKSASGIPGAIQSLEPAK